LNSHADSLSSLLPPPFSLLPIDPPTTDKLYSFACSNPTNSNAERRSSGSDGDRRESTGSDPALPSSSSTKKREINHSSSDESGLSFADEENLRRKSGSGSILTPPTSPKRVTIKDLNKPLPQPPKPASPPESNPRLSGSSQDESSASPISPSPTGVGLGIGLDLKPNQLPSSSFLGVFSESNEVISDLNSPHSGKRRGSFLGLRRKSTSGGTRPPNGSSSSPVPSSPILGAFRNRRKVSMTEHTLDSNLLQDQSTKRESKQTDSSGKKRSFSSSAHQQVGNSGSSLGLLIAGSAAGACASPLLGRLEAERDGKRKVKDFTFNPSQQKGSETSLKVEGRQESETSRTLAALSLAPLPLEPSLVAAIEKLRKSAFADLSLGQNSSSLTPAQTPRMSSSATSTPRVQQLQSPVTSELNVFGKTENLGERIDFSSPSFSELAAPWEERRDANGNSSSRRWMGMKLSKNKVKPNNRNVLDSSLINELPTPFLPAETVDSQLEVSAAETLDDAKRAMARLGWIYGSDQARLFSAESVKVSGLERSGFLDQDREAEINAILSDDVDNPTEGSQYKPKPILLPQLRRWSNFTSIYFKSELSMEQIPPLPPRNVPSPVFCPFATPVSCGPLSAVAPVWERERQLALDRLELHTLDSVTLAKITALVTEAKESMEAADAVISVLEGEETFVIGTASEDGSTTVKSPLERASTICGHTLCECLK